MKRVTQMCFFCLICEMRNIFTSCYELSALSLEPLSSSWLYFLLCVCRWSVQLCPSSLQRKPTWCCCRQNMRASVPSGRSGLAHNTTWRVCSWVCVCVCLFAVSVTAPFHNVGIQWIRCLFSPLCGDIQPDIMQAASGRNASVYLCLFRLWTIVWEQCLNRKNMLL